MQARIADVLGLNRADSTVSLDSITSFTGSINTKKAYKKFCKSLYQIGVTPELLSLKEREIFNIFEPQSTSPNSQICDNTTEDQSQLQEGDYSCADALPPSIDENILTDDKPNWNRSMFGWVRMDFLVGPLMLAAVEAGNTKRLIATLEYIRDID